MKKIDYEDEAFKIELRKERESETAYIMAGILTVFSVFLIVMAIARAWSLKEEPCYADIDGIRMQIECE